MPPALAAKLHQAWDDGVSSLVILSGEALSIHGEGLGQFKLARFGKAALIAPIKVREQAIGVLCVARTDPRPFSDREQAMLEAVADYASISLVNARLFQALEGRARHLQQLIDQIQSGEVRQGLRALLAQVETALGEKDGAGWGRALESVGRGLDALLQAADNAAAEPRSEPEAAAR
jgi:GAF domain-containing protein